MEFKQIFPREYYRKNTFIRLNKLFIDIWIYDLSIKD